MSKTGVKRFLAVFYPAAEYLQTTRITDVAQHSFKTEGKVLVNRACEKSVSAEEISAIRDRAQSLRSHALAHHDVRGHDKP